MPLPSGLPYEEEIAFGQWWSGFGDITLKCINRRTVEKSVERFLGWTRKRYQDETEIHIFVRDRSGLYPDSLHEISNHIQKVIGQAEAIPQFGIEQMYVDSIEEVNDPTDESFEDNSLFHLKITVILKYWKT